MFYQAQSIRENVHGTNVSMEHMRLLLIELVARIWANGQNTIEYLIFWQTEDKERKVIVLVWKTLSDSHTEAVEF